MGRTPDIDLSGCSLCLGCVSLCPEVFRLNPAGYVEIIPLDDYPEEAVDELIRNCPEDCISWLDETMEK